MVYLRKQVSNLVFYTQSSSMVISGQFTWETFRNKLQVTFLDDYLSGLYVQKQITKYLSGLYVQKQITEYLWIVCLKTNYRIPGLHDWTVQFQSFFSLCALTKPEGLISVDYI